MVRMLGLQRIHDHFKLGEVTQILQAWVTQKKGPTGESGADTSLKPFKCSPGPSQQCKDAGNLIVSMVCMSEGLRACAGLIHALKRLPLFTRQSIENALQ